MPICFAINAYLGDLHCCLDPSVALGTHVLSSWLGAFLLPCLHWEWKVSGGFAFWHHFFWSIMLCNSFGSGLVFSWVHLPAGKLLRRFIRRFDVVSSPTTAGNLLLPACCLPAAACLLLLPPAAVLLPPERGKGVRQLQGRKAFGHMLVGMKDVTPTKTRGMAVRTV